MFHQSRCGLVNALSLGSANIARHSVPGGDLPALLNYSSKPAEHGLRTWGELYSLIVVQEANLNGFWIHCALQMEDQMVASVNVV